MKKNKKLIKKIGCLIGVFLVALVSICSIIPNKKQNIDYVSADFFNSSYVSNTLPFTVNEKGSLSFPYSANMNVWLTLTFEKINSNINLNINLLSLDSTFSANLQNFSVSSTTSGSNSKVWSSEQWVQFNSTFFVKMAFSLASDFDLLSLSSVKIISNNYGTTQLEYFDANNNIFAIAFLHATIDNQFIRYSESDPVIFPIISPNSSNYAQGYQQGQSDGYNSGYNNGYDTGLSEGRDIGYTTGYGAGKADGLALGSDYTFMSFFSAIFDAPIQALTGLLNFEILGINLYNFVTALFTLGLILALIKLLI